MSDVIVGTEFKVRPPFSVRTLTPTITLTLDKRQADDGPKWSIRATRLAPHRIWIEELDLLSADNVKGWVANYLTAALDNAGDDR